VSSSEDREALRRQINEAFAGAASPGDGRIAEDPRCCPECAHADEAFRGRDWRQMALSGERLPGNYGGLSFLSEEAWRYFLPTYLLAGLRDDSENALNAADNALFHLTPSDAPDRLRDWYHRRASGFNAEQRAALVAFLDYWYAEHPDWFLCLDFQGTRDYWSRPAG